MRRCICDFCIGMKKISQKYHFFLIRRNDWTKNVHLSAIYYLHKEKSTENRRKICEKYANFKHPISGKEHDHGLPDASVYSVRSLSAPCAALSHSVYCLIVQALSSPDQKAAECCKKQKEVYIFYPKR